jgi:hypothetical protein
MTELLWMAPKNSAEPSGDCTMSRAFTSSVPAERTHDKATLALAAAMLLLVGGVVGTLVLGLAALRALLWVCHLRPAPNEVLTW